MMLPTSAAISPWRRTSQLNDANLAAGATMTVTGAGLFLFESMIFDGSRETDGSFRMIGGGDDQLSGGALADLIYGGHGGDVISGGGGADRFIYLAGDDSPTRGAAF
jgi:Ca2+-binding RTX toxin-like protein